MDGTSLSRQRSRWRLRHPDPVPEFDRYVRHRQPANPPEYTFGYLHPLGGCPHRPACSPETSKPYGGNNLGARCKPQPKQAIAHASLADILFYGGAVGGGKSEFAIVEAIALCLRYRGSKVAIFRRTLTQLEQELEGRIIQLAWADSGLKGPNGRPFCKYNKQRHVFKFWNRSELHLCFCNHERDVYKYQSFQIIGLFLDESSHFTEFMVNYLITRVRSPRPGVPKVIRLTSNPGNVGHGWHKRWFIKPTSEELGSRRLPMPFEVWRPLPKKGDPTSPDRILTRQFIPAWFHDNIALKTADPDYLAKVWALGGDKAKQLAEGDWDANESMICGPFWSERHRVMETDALLLDMGLPVDRVIPWHVVPNDHWRPHVGSHIWGSVDYGYGAPWSFHLHASLPGGHTRTFFEFYEARVRDQQQGERIWKALNTLTFDDKKTKIFDGLQWIVYDPEMKGSRKEVGLAKSIIEVYNDACQNRVQFLEGAAGRSARMSRPNRWMDALSTAPDGLPWWSCTTACPHLIRTVPEVPWDEEDPEVEDDAAENHAYEDMGRFFEARPHMPRTQQPDPFDHLKDDPISKAHQEMLAKREKPKPKVLDMTGLVR
jgi:hypothetical protein